MKKLFLAAILMVITLGTFSCTNEDLAATENLYQHQANDDSGSNGGDPEDPNDPNGN